METPLFCPVHGREAQAVYGNRSGYLLHRCTKCGLVYLAVLSQGVNLDFYDDVTETPPNKQKNDAIEYWSLPRYYERHQKTFEFFFAERLQRILVAAPHARSLLDIGCGYGFFIRYAQNFLDKVMGVELNPDVVRFAQASGLPVFHRSAESLSGEESYDCIVMCDVLEHLQDPLAILNLCHRILNPGGVLYIQVPNLLGFKLPWGHSWGLPHHIWQFGKYSLTALLESANFSKVQHKTGILGIIGILEQGGPSLAKQIEWRAAKLFDCGNRLQTIAIKI